MSKKDKEYTIDYFEYQANETRKKYIEELDKVLAIYKRALELACHYMEYDYPKKNDDIYYRKDRELEMIFLNKAKEELEEQK